MEVEEIFCLSRKKTPNPAVEKRLASGFPSPGQDFAGHTLSLDQHLVPRPSSTYFCRVKGQAMLDAGIQDGDLLVVDSSITPKNQQIVVAVMLGELLVRRFYEKKGRAWLLADSKQASHPPIEITQLDDQQRFWGVVTWVLHQPRG